MPDETACFLDDAQRATLEAAMARIIPSDGTPGAREARTVDFVDRYLSGIGHIYPKPDGSGWVKLEGREAEAWRERIDSLRKRYVDGLESLDAVATQVAGSAFTELTDDQQDEVLRRLEAAPPHAAEAIEADRAEAGFAPAAQEPGAQQTLDEHSLDFFGLLVLHTRQGFYADPVYGGNTGHVGWELIGFPGPSSLAEVNRGEHDTSAYFADGPTPERTAS